MGDPTTVPATGPAAEYTEEQLKEAARKALADGNTASAKRLVDAARRAAAAEAGQTSGTVKGWRDAPIVAPKTQGKWTEAPIVGADTAGQTIEAELFDGTILEFPAGTDPAVIQRKAKEITAQRRANAPGPARDAATGLPMAAPPPRADAPASPPALVGEDQSMIDSVFGDGVGRGLQIGTHGAGRGVADLLGLPADIATGATNLGLAGVDNLAELIMGDAAPDMLDYRFSPSVLGSDAIAGTAGQVAERAGLDLIDKSEMSSGEKIGYEANRFGSAAALSGGALARMVPAADDAAALASATGQTPTKLDNMAQVMVDPYRQAAGRTVVGDTSAGLGAGAAVEAVDQNVSDDSEWKPLATLFSALTGGLAGAGAVKAVVDGLPAAASAVTGRAAAWELPLPKDGSGPISNRIADAAARVSQSMATDLPKARSTLAENLSSFPSPSAPKPGPMTMTEDPGLRGLERNYRASGDPALAARLEAQDAGAIDYATERLLSILDESADQPGTLEAIRARPGELRAARDEAALPILRAAQEAGVMVDAQPVADLLDKAMVGPKRPEVLRALQTARSSLNAAGGDTLDTSVAGLYESRKAIGDLIDGRSESNTGQFAKAELIAAKRALDDAMVKAVPEFGEYLDEFRAGSRPLDVFDRSLARNVINQEADLRNVAAKILSPTRYGTEREMGEVLQMIGDNPEAKRGWRAAVADVLVDRVTRNRAGEEIKSGQVVSVYNQHRDTLAKVFSPDDMKALDEVHNLVRMLDQPHAAGRAPNLGASRMKDPISLVQAGLIASGRDLITTTIIVARLNFAARFLGLSKLTTPHKVNEVLMRMQFDPDLATAILNRPVAEGTGATWSRDVQKMLAAGAAGREASDEDETVDLIMSDQ